MADDEGYPVTTEQDDVAAATAVGKTRGAAAGEVIGGALGTAWGATAQQLATLLEQGAPVAARHAETVRTQALRSAAAVRESSERLVDADAVAALRGVGREVGQGVNSGTLAVQSVLEGVLEDVREQGRQAVALVSGRPRRRWPWAAGAAVGGAALAAAAVVAARQLFGRDSAGAQEPEHLQAVIDPLGGPAASVDPDPTDPDSAPPG